MLQSLLLLIFVTISLGLIVGHIVRPSFELTARRLAAVSQGDNDFALTVDRADSARRGPVSNSSINSDFSPSLPYLAGIAGVAATFAIFAVLIALLWLIIFLIGKVPSLGQVTLRLAQRNLSTNRLRTAITLLALSAGMFALSSIAFVGEGTRELLNLQLSRTFGGNVLVFPFPGLPQSLIKNAIDNALDDVDITYRSAIDTYDAQALNLKRRAPAGG